MDWLINNDFPMNNIMIYAAEAHLNRDQLNLYRKKENTRNESELMELAVARALQKPQWEPNTTQLKSKQWSAIHSTFLKLNFSIFFLFVRVCVYLFI